MPRNNDPGDWESRYRAELKKNPGSIGILMEGDSWFSFPNVLRTNIYMALDEMNGPHASIWSLAHSGDTAHQITTGWQYSNLLRLFTDKTLQIDAFLFSAGGNDIAGDNILPILNQFEQGMDALDCVNHPVLDARLGDIRECYERIIDLRDKLRPGMPIFTHSYDFAVPNGAQVKFLWLPLAGGWLKEKCASKGIPEALHGQIITHLLSRFASLIDSFEWENANFIHVRTQGTLAANEWGDELHPTMAGYKKVAAKFQTALREWFPNLPEP